MSLAALGACVMLRRETSPKVAVLATANAPLDFALHLLQARRPALTHCKAPVNTDTEVAAQNCMQRTAEVSKSGSNSLGYGQWRALQAQLYIPAMLCKLLL